jgi:hypothetical protein
VLDLVDRGVGACVRQNPWDWRALRFVLGAGEAGNWPGAAKSAE